MDTEKNSSTSVSSSSVQADKNFLQNIDIPRPLFDIKNFLPEEIVPTQNGIMPPNKLQKVYCGGELYTDAARSWTAMVRVAAREGVFLNLNLPFNAYRNITTQIKSFKDRFLETNEKSAEFIQIEYSGKIWQLKEDKKFIDAPGTSSHGFGLAVYIVNAGLRDVKAWLEKNAEQFGFVEEYAFEPGHFAYIKSREEIPSKVLEVESWPPEPKYSAKQIEEAAGCSWVTPPPEDWSCSGFIYSEPFRTGYLALVDQGAGIGANPKKLSNKFRQVAGIICTDPKDFEKYKRPVLVTSNPQETVEKLSKFFTETPAENISSKVEDSPLQIELNFFKRVNPETLIFQKKKAMAEKLLEISVEDLKNAPEQPWYEEYIALLPIKFENPALCAMAEEYSKELLSKYNENASNDKRELAVLGLLQFMSPEKFNFPFNQNLWHKEMIIDVQGVFLNYFTRVNYADEDISIYYLSRLQMLKHGKRKMRVAFLFHSGNRGDKMLPLYAAMRERDDIEAFFVIHPGEDRKHNSKRYKYFHEKFPDDVIYDSDSLADLRKLKPDYVFFQFPYESRRPFTSFNIQDVVKFAKPCNLSYGATLAYTFADRMFDDYPQFFRDLYFVFCSAEEVKNELTKRFSENVDFGYQHFEFFGYPILEHFYKMPATESSVKRILWTPRWGYSPRVGGSHFIEFKDEFISLHEKYGDNVKLSVRPHIATFDHLIKKGLMTEKEISDYKATLKKNNITLHSASSEIEADICCTDIFLADYSSILIVLFLTGRPIIYCEFSNAVPFPEYEEMFNAMYIAHTWEEVERYLDDLINDRDPLFEKRQEIAEKIYLTHKGATQRIIERLLQDFKENQIDDDEKNLYLR